MRAGLSNGTQNRYCASISIIFKKAEKLGFIEAYPKFSWKTESAGRPRFFNDDEVKKLDNFFRTDNHYSRYFWLKDFLTIGLYTGMRLSEILLLKDGVAKIMSDEKGDEFIRLPKGKTKNGESRDVPIYYHPDLVAAVHRVVATDFVYNHHIFHKAWRKARRLIAPGDKDFTFHVTRHTCASNLANKQNTNLKVIAEYLGHRSINTTTKYVHASHDAKKQALAGLTYSYGEVA